MSQLSNGFSATAGAGCAGQGGGGHKKRGEGGAERRDNYSISNYRIHTWQHPKKNKVGVEESGKRGYYNKVNKEGQWTSTDMAYNL